MARSGRRAAQAASPDRELIYVPLGRAPLIKKEARSFLPESNNALPFTNQDARGPTVRYPATPGSGHPGVRPPGVRPPEFACLPDSVSHRAGFGLGCRHRYV